MEFSMKELSKLLDGKLVGNPDVIVSKPSKIEEGGEGSISFLHNPRYEAYLYTTSASAVLVPENFEPRISVKPTLLKVKNVYNAMALTLEKFSEPVLYPTGIADESVIHPSVSIGKKVSVGIYTVIEQNGFIGENTIIYPQVFIGKNVSIGKNCVLFPGVRILADCEIGDHCIIHANVVIGCDGFGFVSDGGSLLRKIPQLGNVILEDYVEIGANSTIDRATLGATIIKKGVKIDNLVQIGHNAEVGENTVIAAQTGVAGSTHIGSNCQIGGQVGFSGHLKIADGTKIQGQSGISASITTSGQSFMGSPAIPYISFLKSFSVFKQLPSLILRLQKIEKKLNQP
jgi:UDP-3-O-[3-hydroxymyristoyl] glucosamine N-acyltransferase